MTKKIFSITLLVSIMIFSSITLFADRLGQTKGVVIYSDAGKKGNKVLIKFTIKNTNKHGVNVDVTLIGETNNDECSDTSGSRKVSTWLKAGESKTYTVSVSGKCEITGLCVSYEDFSVSS